MSVTPPISSFFGLDPRFLGAPAASSSLINPLLFGASSQMVAINFGGFNSGIPPIFGGQGFTGFSTVPFDIFSQPSVLVSPFSGGAAFGSGFGTQAFGANPFSQSTAGNFTFNNQAVNPFDSTLQNMAIAQSLGFQPQVGGAGFAVPVVPVIVQNPFGFTSFF